MKTTHLIKKEIGEVSMKKVMISLICLLVFVAFNIFSQGVTKVGITASPFLLIDPTPRATAMGSAYVSVANDVSAMYWNPAGIASIPSFDAMFVNSMWLAEMPFNFAAVAMSMGDAGTVGISTVFLNSGKMERTTVTSPDGTGEFFDAGDYAIGLSYARYLTDQFSIGFNAKYISQRIYHCNATGFALDIGVLFDTKFSGLKLGMSISNFGTKMRLDGRDLIVPVDVDPASSGNNPSVNALLQTMEYDLPLFFRFGLSMDILKGLYNSNLILSVDALHPNDDVEYINIGGEYSFSNIVFLRAGWKELFKKDSDQSVTFGAGLKYDFGGTIVYCDFSYLYFHRLGDRKMFSIGLGF